MGQQRRDVGQFLPFHQGTGVLRRDKGDAGILGVEGGVQGDLKVTVTARSPVGHARLAHGVDIGVHDRVGGVMAEKPQHILDLGPGGYPRHQAAQKSAGIDVVHPVAQAGQVIAALGRGLPDLKTKQRIRPVGSGRKRRRVLNVVVNAFRRPAGDAYMGISFGH